MSAKNRVLNAQSFLKQNYSNLMPAASKHMVSPLIADTFGVATEVVQSSWTSILPTASIYGQVATFTIPRAVGRIYELLLEVNYPAETGVTLCPYAAVKLVQRYEVDVGGLLIETDGDSMFQTRQSFLSNTSKNFFADLAGGTAAASIANTAAVTQWLVLDYPGCINVNQDSSVFTHDDSYGIPFPLNKCNANMNINITLAPRADIVVAGTSTFQPTLKLHYSAVWSSNVGEDSVNNGANAQDIFIPGYTLQSQARALSIAPGAEASIELNSVFKNGQLLKLISRFSDDATVAAKKYYNGNELGSLKMGVDGVDFFSVSSASEAKAKDGLNRRNNPFYDGCANPFYYEIWGSVDPYQITSDQYQCINLYNGNAVLRVSPSTETTTSYKIISVTKCVYRIDRSGTVNRLTGKSGSL